MIYKFNIPDEIYDELLKIKEDKSVKHNSKLAGNIREEYLLNKHLNIVEPFIINELSKIDDLKKYCSNLNIMYPNPLPLKLESLWVNYQKKHEFNPLHNHSGIFSFILFIKIPYLHEQERSLSPGIEANSDISGMLSFYFADSGEAGGIGHLTLPVDQTWEKTGLIFKASLNHEVYPFFSEGVRITMSGNVSFYNGN